MKELDIQDLIRVKHIFFRLFVGKRNSTIYAHKYKNHWLMFKMLKKYLNHGASAQDTHVLIEFLYDNLSLAAFDTFLRTFTYLGQIENIKGNFHQRLAEGYRQVA